MAIMRRKSARKIRSDRKPPVWINATEGEICWRCHRKAAAGSLMLVFPRTQIYLCEKCGLQFCGPDPV